MNRRRDSLRDLRCVAFSFVALFSPFAARAQDAVPSMTPLPVVTVEPVRAPSGPNVSLAASPPAPAFHSLESVLQWSYSHNPQLRSDRAALQAIEEALPQAQAGYKPTVTANVSLEVEHLNVYGPTLSALSNAGGGGNGNSAFGSSIDDTGLVRTANAQVSQPLYRGGQTVASLESARATIAAQRALTIDDGQRVMLQVATAYMDVVRDQQIVTTNEANVADLQEQYGATKSRYDVGSTTRTDLAQAEAALAAAQADLTAAGGTLKISRATFEQLVGFPPGQVAEPRLSFPFPPNLDDATAAADQANPQIAAARNMHNASKADAARLRGQLLPQVSLVGAAARTDNPAPGLKIHETSEAATLQGTWALYQGGAERSRVRQADATANQRDIDILSTRRNVRQEVVTAWENLTATRAEIASRQAQVAASSLAALGTRKQAEVGARSVLDSLDSEQLLRNARVALVGAQHDAVVATFTLAETLGLLQPQTIGFPATALDDSREPPAP